MKTNTSAFSLEGGQLGHAGSACTVLSHTMHLLHMQVDLITLMHRYLPCVFYHPIVIYCICKIIQHISSCTQVIKEQMFLDFQNLYTKSSYIDCMLSYTQYVFASKSSYIDCMLPYTIGQTCVHIIVTHLLALAESEFDILCDQFMYYIHTYRQLENLNVIYCSIQKNVNPV